MKKIVMFIFSIILLWGCSTSNDKETTKKSIEEYPIVIKHAYGETTITEKPKNIASLFWGNQDVPLALGITPVGVSKANYGAEKNQDLLPWTIEGFKKLGVDKPIVFNDVDGLDYEAISKVKPDIIIAAYSGITKEEYDLLSEIAPVIPFEEAAYQTTWKKQISINATAIGMANEGEALVKDLENLIIKEVNKYPAIKGKTAAFMYFDVSDLSQFYIYGENDPRAAYLLDLGLKNADSITNLLKGSTEFGTYFSAEKVEALSDVDIIILYGDKTTLETLQKDPLIGKIPAIKNGSVVILEDNTPIAAASTPSALSIPNTIVEYTKLIDEAVQKIK